MFGNLFKGKTSKPAFDFSQIKVDMHNHLVPGIDDGAQTAEESLKLTRRLLDLGFSAIIATPHIMADYYRNTHDTINRGLDLWLEVLQKHKINIKISVAAEYYLDETFEARLHKKEMLTMGNDFVLFELSYINYPQNLKEVIQKINDKGFKPILAHPERYPYLFGSIENYYQVKEYGCYFQLNTISLTGYYGKNVQKAAFDLVDEKLVDFLGSDMHHLRHADALAQALSSSHLKKLFQDNMLQNHMLL